MLSAVLNSETAINVSIKIMNAFVECVVSWQVMQCCLNASVQLNLVYTFPKTKLSQTDIKNFNAQYPKLEVKMTNAFHDRFMVLDDKTVYHIGASIKDAGKKCFGITLIQDDTMANDLISRLKKITPFSEKCSYWYINLFLYVFHYFIHFSIMGSSFYLRIIRNS